MQQLSSLLPRSPKVLNPSYNHARTPVRGVVKIDGTLMGKGGGLWGIKRKGSTHISTKKSGDEQRFQGATNSHDFGYPIPTYGSATGPTSGA